MQTCEQEAGVSGGDKSESIMRLAWALVHSRNAPDVQRGIAMLEGSFHPCVKKKLLCAVDGLLVSLSLSLTMAGDFRLVCIHVDNYIKCRWVGYYDRVIITHLMYCEWY